MGQQTSEEVWTAPYIEPNSNGDNTVDVTTPFESNCREAIKRYVLDDDNQLLRHPEGYKECRARMKKARTTIPNLPCTAKERMILDERVQTGMCGGITHIPGPETGRIASGPPR